MTHKIRSATMDDVPAMVEIYRPYVEQSCTSFELETPTADAFAERVATALQGYDWLVMQSGDQVVGYAYGSSHRARAAYRFFGRDIRVCSS